MNNALTALTVAATLFGASLAHAASATGTASATVLAPIAISQATALDFGTFASGATAGTVTSAGTASGGVTLIEKGAPAGFKVTGSASRNFTITVPASVTLTSGASSMTASLSAPTSSTLDALGKKDIAVTGTLSVAANQAAGNYNGTYTITANY